MTTEYQEGDYTPFNPNAHCGVSASNVARLIACPASFVLPQAPDTGEAAVRGNILHEFCRTVQANPDAREAALAAIKDEKIRATAEGIDLATALDGIDVVGLERAFVLNAKTRTVRVAGDNIGRKYKETLAAKGMEPLGKYDVPCTMDVVGFVMGNTPCELDYKSGQSIGAIEDHWQRRVCATALMIYYDAPTCMSRVAYIWENGTIVGEGHEFSALDIDDFCDEIVAARDAVEAARALLTAGTMPKLGPTDSECKYCPAFHACAYQTNFARAMLGELEIIDGTNLTALTPEQWGKAWSLMKRAAKIVEKIEKAGKEAAQKTPLIDGEYEIAPQWQAGKQVFSDSKARGEIVKLMQKLGADEDAIQEKLKSLTVTGKSFAKFPRTKRALPVVNVTEERKAS